MHDEETDDLDHDTDEDLDEDLGADDDAEHEPELSPFETETFHRLVLEHIPEGADATHRLSQTLLPVDRARDELLELAEEQASLELAVERLEDEKREAAKGYKKRIDAKRERIRELAKVIDDGAQDALVPTVAIANFVSKEMRVFRLDTGDLVETRTLTADELQSDLFEG